METRDENNWSVVYDREQMKKVNREITEVLKETLVYLAAHGNVGPQHPLIVKLSEALAKSIAVRL